MLVDHRTSCIASSKGTAVCQFQRKSLMLLHVHGCSIHQCHSAVALVPSMGRPGGMTASIHSQQFQMISDTVNDAMHGVAVLCFSFVPGTSSALRISGRLADLHTTLHSLTCTS